MRQQDHLAALAGDLADRRSDALEPRGVGDAAVLHGHVEVDAQQHALALHVDVIEGAELFGHLALPASWPGNSRPEERRRLARLCSAIHVLDARKNVDARHKAGHEDESYRFFPIATAVSAMRL